MTSMYVHFFWFTIFLVLFLLVFLWALTLSYLGQCFYLSFNMFSLWNLDMTVSFYVDFMAVWFSTIILLISSVIMVYSYFYMAPYSKTVYFLWLTNLFILSMLLVVNMSNLFFLMLGWDGLGLVSFFLIVYYQNQTSITSGVFTLLMNRIGDSFFLVTIMVVFYYQPDFVIFGVSIPSKLVSLLMLFTFMTKSAIYPFSPWLPLAMAAPTPISALVHSSTLVTAGLYLMMRFSYYLYCSYELMQLLLILSLFTSFYAGMNSIFEKDLKKMIALSTLSHLGFIGMAFSVGLLELAFFHMLTHALFKSLLFMTMGDIMINLNHSQDIRYLSSGMVYTPFSSMVMYVSLLNLLGMPNVSGFFSKDMVLEMMNYSSSSAVVITVLFLNVFFTYYYTYQLFFYSFQPVKLVPYQNFHYPMVFHAVLLLAMACSTLFFGFFFMSVINSFLLFYPVPVLNKMLPLVINLAMFLMLYLLSKQFTSNSPLVNYYFSNMMFLSNLCLSLSSSLYYHIGFMLVKTVELGLFSFSVNTYTSSSLIGLSNMILNLSMVRPMNMVLFSGLFLLVLCLFI
nr:NADH dehydrogenase subunit 5 [Brachionus falcatus]